MDSIENTVDVVNTSQNIIPNFHTIINDTHRLAEVAKASIPENYQIILLSFAYGIISLLALVGNSSIIYIVIRNRRMHSVTNYFICNLALADCLVACFAIPFQVEITRPIGRLFDRSCSSSLLI
jgi:leucokinin receptor